MLVRAEAWHREDTWRRSVGGKEEGRTQLAVYPVSSWGERTFPYVGHVGVYLTGHHRLGTSTVYQFPVTFPWLIVDH